MKIFSRILSAIFVIGIAAAGLFIGLVPHYTVPVVMYHQVKQVNPPEADTISPAMLHRQWEFMRKQGFHVVGLETLVDAIEKGQRLPWKTVVITFDDGYVDDYTEALPLIREYGYPVTFFISPDFFGKEGFLDQKQIIAMKNEGAHFGSHGMTQAYLPDQNEEHLRYEVVTSKAQLENFLNQHIDFLAYPIGGFNDHIKALLKSAGYRAGLTTNRGNDRFDLDLYEINRIRLGDRDNNWSLWVKLSGYYNLFRHLRPSH